MDSRVSERYSRQVVLPEVGASGQARLAAAAVAVVGAGGLGCAALPYLAAAGVGRLHIIDHDRVAESNLHRQPLYRMSDLGARKAEAARAALLALNPTLHIDAVPERLTPANAAAVAAAADVIVDAADSFAVTYALSDACQQAGKPLVSASVLALAGYVGAFCGGAPSYRAVFPELPRLAGSCAASGVLGTAVAVMGTLQAHLTLALLLELEPPVLGRLLSVDFRTLHVGEMSFAQAPEPAARFAFIAPQQVAAADLVIDLRSLAEAPVSPFPAALRIDVEALERGVQLPEAPRIVLCCRTGIRAWRAARALDAGGRRNLALIALGE
ncbi:MAG: ThiF family adenylyltransferase [Gammaproteobacteria bacterium]|nr:ThiF family adenylyltransferase [Gammaproteobacteria bacterium]